MSSLVVKRSFLAIFMLLFSLAPLSLPATYAVDLFPDDVVCKGEAANSTACKETKDPNAPNPLFGQGGIITRIVFFISILIAIAAVVVIMLAGFKFITSGSNPQEVTKAREMIIYAVAGLVVAAFAQALVRFFLNVIG